MFTNPGYNELMNSGPVILLRQLCDLVGSPDPFTLLTRIDANPDALSAHVEALATAREAVAAARSEIRQDVIDVDTGWEGAASTAFRQYMDRYDTFLTDVEAKLDSLLTAGRELVALVQEIVDSTQEYINSKLAGLGQAVGGFLGGGAIGSAAPGLGTVVAAVAGAIIAYLANATERMSRLGETAGLLDHHNALATGFGAVHYDLGTRGLHADQVDADGWRPVAVG